MGGCSKETGLKSDQLFHLLVLTLGTNRLIPLIGLSERDGRMRQAWSEDKQAVFHEAFCRSTNLS